MNIRPITDDELPAYIDTTRREYAEDKHRNGGIPLDEALRQSERETAQLFPDDRLCPGHEIFIGEDDAGARVGRLWMAPRGGAPDTAFIYDIQVEPAARGKGYGRAIMQAAAQWARDNGYRALSLHVFGGNDIAINLYESLGFTTTDRFMQLEL
ncbi:GNAT family N-acetyltransferase [Flexivirga caeni]|uniref:GNAT family N-acetyltransferase n=1 Tax=Flexivirga caeni TaxID=2294115 RepID=A0A3M9M6T1_9MICO|nr:GNAT family N-acetyltransferase [Flexivirga caeni]RNI21284.1 GNAT family N-acetyltransferase [Flexivirga caeni]